MPTPVVMPQMGESIAEGTLVRWIKKLGDRVDRDEPLFEISTDKVDAEIPSPASGVLLDIKVHEGETVPVESVVATIGEPGEATVTAPVSAAPAAAPAAEAPAPPAKSPKGPAASRTAPRRAAPSVQVPGEVRKLKSSPVVRRIARDHQVDISQIAGTGVGGRVTKHDILGYLEHHPEGSDGGDQVQPLSIMRRKIAEHMVLSRRTSAHVHTVFHVNFTHVDRLRQQHRARYEQQGSKLTYMAFIARVVAQALTRFKVVNASLDGTNVIYKKDVNIGIAVALESGLIVPVVRHADRKSLFDLSRAIQDVAERARAKQLKTDEVHEGTFTITNPGNFGAQFGLPIINQPQVAILGVGTIEKRPVVVDDAIGIRTMAYLALGFDHRLVDGAVADEFMAAIKQGIELFDPGEA